MSVETEIKLRVESHEPVRARLGAVGAQWSGRVLETNWILDFADGSLRRQGCGLRVRDALEYGTGDRQATLTFKGPRAAGPFKIREEIETAIDDAEATLQILAFLGLSPVLRYEKRRESWRLGECKIELDEPPEIGLFVEIEGPDQALIREVQGKLELTGAEPEQASYVDLLIDYCDRSGLRERTLELPPLG